MSEAETRDLIERCIDAFNSGKHDAVLACLSDDVAHDDEAGARAIGPDHFRWYLGRRARHYRETVADAVIMVAEEGGRAAVEFTLRGTYLATADGMPEANGQRFSVAAGAFLDIDDGRISRVTICLAPERLEAALSGK